jgi:hypothetical protein
MRVRGLPGSTPSHRTARIRSAAPTCTRRTTTRPPARRTRKRSALAHAAGPTPRRKGTGHGDQICAGGWAHLPRVGLVAQHLGRHPRRRAYLRPLGRRSGCKRACCDVIPWEAVYPGSSGDTFTVRETLPALAVLKSAILRQFAPKSQRMLWLFRSRCITCTRANHGVRPV